MLDPITQAPRPARELEPITQAPPISQSLGRMQQAPPAPQELKGLGERAPQELEPMTQRDLEPSSVPSQGYRGGNRGSASFTTDNTATTQIKDDSPRPEANRRYKLAASSPSAGTQYGEDIAGRPAPQSVHRVANRSIGPVGSPEGWFGTDFMKGVGYYPPQDTYLTLDPSEQYALQQNGYIDLNGLRYAKNDYGEIVNIGSTPGRDTGGLGYVRPMGPGEF